MKKLTLITLALSIFISAFTPFVFADDNLEEIIIDVKTRAEISDEYTEFSSSSNTGDYFTSYNFNWETEDGKSEIAVGYNSDNVITSYSRYDNSYERYDGTSLPKISEDEAKSAAQEFIDKLNPDLKGKFIVENGDASSALNGNYCFSIQRYNDDIPVYRNTGSIYVDRSSGEIENMYISYTHISEFAPLTDLIGSEEAQSAYAQKLGLELVYKMYYEKDKRIVFPAYTAKETNKYIDARDGSVYDASISLYTHNAKNESAKVTADAEAGGSSARASLSESELNEIEKIGNLISKTDIEKQLRENKILNIPEDLPLSSIYLQRDYYDDTRYTYSVSFRGSGNGSIYISADAATGEIISYYTYDGSYYDESENETPDEEQIKDHAKTVFDALAGSKKSEYEYLSCNDYTVIYQRMVNGIKMSGDLISITVDADGSLQSYNSNYTTNVEFPSINEAMNAEDAAKCLFENIEYNITYYPYADNDGKTLALPLYMPAAFTAINPFTGKLVDYKNEETADSSEIEYSDIEGHYAKNQIETLAKYGIGFDGGKFLPDEKITQRDFLYLMMTAANIYFSDDDGMYERAESLGYIFSDERDKNAEVTRENAAKLIIRVMGAEKFAEYDDIYVTPFKDVTENKGYIAILSAMKIVNGDGNGSFNPKNSLTRAEAACMIYNYLNR